MGMILRREAPLVPVLGGATHLRGGNASSAGVLTAGPLTPDDERDERTGLYPHSEEEGDSATDPFVTPPIPGVPMAYAAGRGFTYPDPGSSGPPHHHERVPEEEGDEAYDPYMAYIVPSDSRPQSTSPLPRDPSPSGLAPPIPRHGGTSVPPTARHSITQSMHSRRASEEHLLGLGGLIGAGASGNDVPRHHRASSLASSGGPQNRNSQYLPVNPRISQNRVSRDVDNRSSGSASVYSHPADAEGAGEVYRPPPAHRGIDEDLSSYTEGDDEYGDDTTSDNDDDDASDDTTHHAVDPRLNPSVFPPGRLSQSHLPQSGSALAPPSAFGNNNLTRPGSIRAESDFSLNDGEDYSRRVHTLSVSTAY